MDVELSYEQTQKICRQCGTPSGSLVLVCPVCTEVLPDLELPLKADQDPTDLALELHTEPACSKAQALPVSFLRPNADVEQVTLLQVEPFVEPLSVVLRNVLATIAALALMIWLLLPLMH